MTSDTGASQLTCHKMCTFSFIAKITANNRRLHGAFSVFHVPDVFEVRVLDTVTCTNIIEGY